MHNDAILIKEQRIVDEAIRAIESVSVLFAGGRDGLAHSGTTVLSAIFRFRIHSAELPIAG